MHLRIASNVRVSRMSVLNRISVMFRRNPSKLHSENLQERIGCARKVVETALKKQPGGHRMGETVYSEKTLDGRDRILGEPLKHEANQAGFEILDRDKNVVGLVHFATGFPARPIIFVSKVKRQLGRELSRALQREAKYVIFRPKVHETEKKLSITKLYSKGQQEEQAIRY
jgi:hypothetical protein